MSAILIWTDWHYAKQWIVNCNRMGALLWQGTQLDVDKMITAIK